MSHLVINPATEQEVATVDLASVEQTDAAIERSQRASYATSSTTTPPHRNACSAGRSRSRAAST
jgi:acyl-CoA reductase-like NAD-dependent aldehyde dehydrogenase